MKRPSFQEELVTLLDSVLAQCRANVSVAGSVVSRCWIVHCEGIIMVARCWCNNEKGFQFCLISLVIELVVLNCHGVLFSVVPFEIPIHISLMFHRRYAYSDKKLGTVSDVRNKIQLSITHINIMGTLELFIFKSVFFIPLFTF